VINPLGESVVGDDIGYFPPAEAQLATISALEDEF
jgi:hypothetical protein